MDGTQLFFLPLIFLFPLKKSTIRMGPLIGPVVIEYNPPLHTHTHTVDAAPPQKVEEMKLSDLNSAPSQRFALQTDMNDE